MGTGAISEVGVAVGSAAGSAVGVAVEFAAGSAVGVAVGAVSDPDDRVTAQARERASTSPASFSTTKR